MPSETIVNIKNFTREEVIKHNKKTDCWIIIENNVYDLTTFIAQHLGGCGTPMKLMTLNKKYQKNNE